MRRIMIAACLLLAGCGSDDQRPAGALTFAPEVEPGDREWILAAVEKVRPEARRLIDDVDGMITVTTYRDPAGGAVGLARQTGEQSYELAFNLAYLNGDRKLDRDATVAHELAHVIDHALVEPELRDRLAAQLPSSGACLTAHTGDCTSPTERFADTFAKWALRGAVSVTGAGYGVTTPASLEDWGAPLAELAIAIEVASR